MVTSYPNVTAMTVIKNPKKTSSLRRPEYKINTIICKSQQKL